MKKEFQVDAQVQAIKDDTIKDGVVVEFLPSKRPEKDYWTVDYSLREECFPSVRIKFDDGTEETVSTQWVNERDNELERKFRLTCIEAHEKIFEQLDIASQAIARAEMLSEEYGVPFSSGVSPLSQSFHPASLETKFPDLDKEFVNDLTDTYNEYGGGGWDHSQVC